MFHLIRVSAGIAFQTLRANIFHTFLSTLGIVIGVAALVAILALGDGMERFGREQVANTTSLQAIVITPKTYEEVDGIRVRKEKISLLHEAHFTALKALMGQKADLSLQTMLNGRVELESDSIRTTAILYFMANPIQGDTPAMAFGRLLNATDFEQKAEVAVISHLLAKKFAKEGGFDKLLGKQLQWNDHRLTIVGITAPKDKEMVSGAMFPFFLLSEADLADHPANLVIKAKVVEDVPTLKVSVEKYLDENTVGGKRDYEILTNETRVEQLSKGIRLFKIIMGLITGIAIVVGGIGVMNVMLMSVNERTREIGIRKAAGARRKDIATQFLAEALAISLFGSIIGALLGFTTIFIASPIVRSIAEMPFYAAFNPQSALIVLLVAMVVGASFGAYPAWKAAKLTPVDAIRHE